MRALCLANSLLLEDVVCAEPRSDVAATLVAGNGWFELAFEGKGNWDWLFPRLPVVFLVSLVSPLLRLWLCGYLSI